MKILTETGERVSLSTVKQVLYQHGLKGFSARKKPLLQKQHKKKKKVRLQFANAHRDMSCGLIKLKLNCLAIMTIFGGKRVKLASLRSSIMMLGCFTAGGTGALH